MPTLRFSVFGKIVFYTVFSLAAWGIISAFLPHGSSERPNPKGLCVNNLRMINDAKEQWALENHKSPGDIPTWADVKIYMGHPNKKLLVCPQGGVYTLGSLSNHPTCSVPGHVLP